MASDMAMNDSLLRKGDIVATDRGFFIFRGQGPDGITKDFAPVSKQKIKPEWLALPDKSVQAQTRQGF
jgi:hypothetical protein